MVNAHETRKPVRNGAQCQTDSSIEQGNIGESEGRLSAVLSALHQYKETRSSAWPHTKRNEVPPPTVSRYARPLLKATHDLSMSQTKSARLPPDCSIEYLSGCNLTEFPFRFRPGIRMRAIGSKRLGERKWMNHQNGREGKGKARKPHFATNANPVSALGSRLLPIANQSLHLISHMMPHLSSGTIARHQSSSSLSSSESVISQLAMIRVAHDCPLPILKCHLFIIDCISYLPKQQK